MTTIRQLLLPDGRAWAGPAEVVCVRHGRPHVLAVPAVALAPGDHGEVLALTVDRHLWACGPRRRPACQADLVDAFDAKPGLLVTAAGRRLEIHSPRAATALALPQDVVAVACLPHPEAAAVLAATRAETWLLAWSEADGSLRSTPLGLGGVVTLALLPGTPHLALLREAHPALHRVHVCELAHDPWRGLHLRPFPTLLADPGAPTGLRPGPAAVAGGGRWFLWSGGTWRPTPEIPPANGVLTLRLETAGSLEPRPSPAPDWAIHPDRPDPPSDGSPSRRRERLETTRPSPTDWRFVPTLDGPVYSDHSVRKE